MDFNTAAVFGGTGKIGRHVVDLLRRRMAVRALIHRTPLEDDGLTLIRGSVADADPVHETIRGADVVVQMATTKEDPETFFDVSIRGTFNVLEACRANPVKQFILLSGDAVMGIWFYPQPVPIDEGHPLTAYPGHYAFSKVVEEVMAQQYLIQYGLPVCVLRSSWVFEADDLLDHFSILKNVDPTEKGHGFGEVAPEGLGLVRAGQERIPVLTDGDGAALRRHIVHLDDLTQAFDKMIGNDAAIGESFNIAGPAAFDYRTAADYLTEKTRIPSVEIRCPDYHPFEIDIDRARSVLGYAPKNDIFRMIDRALEVRSKAVR